MNIAENTAMKVILKLKGICQKNAKLYKIYLYFSVLALYTKKVRRDIMEKTDNKNILLTIVLGILIVLAMSALLFFTVGPVYGNDSAANVINEAAETAVAREEQEPVLHVSIDETITVAGSSGGVTAAETDAAMAAETDMATAAETPPHVEDAGMYILPESNSRYYTREELDKLDDRQLYLARNEIYARLGRKFKADELNQHFRACSWYQPKYEPSVFDSKGDGIFNPYELSNRNLIISIEEERKGR